MKFFTPFAVALLLSSPAFGWNLRDHRDMAKLALADVAKEWGLDETCEVRPLSAFLEKLKPLRPEIADPWQFSHYLKVNPKVDLGTTKSLRFPEAPAHDKKITPLEVFALYATDPDDGRDQNMFVRDAQGDPQAMFPEQKWFGAVQGPNSQAFRHIEKPPFNFRRPVATSLVPFRSLGEASSRTEIYFRLSQLAFAVGEDYWGWRFLAGGLHYLQDLHQPYHAGQATPTLFKRGLQVFLSWGWGEKGFMGSFAHVISNSHRFFETYVDESAGYDAGLKEIAVRSLGGKTLAPLSGSVGDLAREVRDASNRLYGRLSRAVEDMTGDSLYGHVEFYSDGDKNPNNSRVEDFIRQSPKFADANAAVFEIVTDRFASAGRTTRAYVKAALDERQNTLTPGEILQELDRLLPPSDDDRIGGETE